MFDQLDLEGIIESANKMEKATSSYDFLSEELHYGKRPPKKTTFMFDCYKLVGPTK
jgi:hypothetical protein